METGLLNGADINGMLEIAQIARMFGTKVSFEATVNLSAFG